MSVMIVAPSSRGTGTEPQFSLYVDLLEHDLISSVVMTGVMTCMTVMMVPSDLCSVCGMNCASVYRSICREASEERMMLCSILNDHPLTFISHYV